MDASSLGQAVNPPPVIVVVVTYRRLRLAIETIRSVKEKLIWPNIGFHLADDGSGPAYLQALVQEIGPNYSVTVSNAERGGVGHSMNLGIEAALGRADLWLHLEDDWALPAPLDLAPFVQLLQEDASLGMIRMGYISAGIEGKTFPGADRMWLRLKKNSDTYVYAGHAALKHRRFHEAYGGFPVGLAPGQTEVSYCGKFNAKPGPDIAWPLWMPETSMFRHIGDSQSFKYYMESEGKTAEEAAALFEQQ